MAWHALRARRHKMYRDVDYAVEDESRLLLLPPPLLRRLEQHVCSAGEMGGCGVDDAGVGGIGGGIGGEAASGAASAARRHRVLRLLRRHGARTSGAASGGEAESGAKRHRGQHRGRHRMRCGIGGGIEGKAASWERRWWRCSPGSNSRRFVPRSRLFVPWSSIFGSVVALLLGQAPHRKLSCKYVDLHSEFLLQQ